MLNRNLNLQPSRFTGNYSGIISDHIEGSRAEIRRGFTTFRLMIILREAYNVIIVELDIIHRIWWNSHLTPEMAAIS
jgi:hypothetical protein